MDPNDQNDQGQNPGAPADDGGMGGSTPQDPSGTPAPADEPGGMVPPPPPAEEEHPADAPAEVPGDGSAPDTDSNPAA